MAREPEAAALTGLRVVEFGAREAVAACGSLLAQLGAEVVLVESGRGEHKWRDRPATAAGKVSVADAAHLVGAADVLLLSSDLSDVDRRLWEGSRPARQIRCDISAFGHAGPLAGRAGSPALVTASTGVAATTGRPDGPPALLGAPLLEMEAAVYAAAAILAALRVRRQHGVGQRVEIAVYDVGVNALAAFLPLPFSGRVATRNGNRHPTLSPWNSYRARDGWVVICAPTGHQWARLAEAMGRPGLVEDVRFATTTARMEHADDIDDVVGAWVAEMSTVDCVRRLADATIPCGPIVPVRELAEEPNLSRRGMVRTAIDPVSGREVALPGCPLRGAGARAATRIPAPGADSVEWGAADGKWIDGDPRSDVRPLAGIRVIEVGMNTVGPLAGKTLGALGADVIKVEPPRGDVNRHNAPLRADGEAYVFALLNTDKRGIVLDLREPRDQAILWDLLATADVLVENLKPGSLGRLGFGADEVRERFPRLVYCSMNGFGHDTAYPGRPALDTVVQAMSGVLSTTVVDDMPVKAGISVSDQLGGLFGLLGVLAALERRETTGAGATLDIAMQDGSAWATHRVWRAGPEEARIEGDVLVERGERNPVWTVADVLAHPHTAARGLVVERPTPDGSSWPVLGSPMKLRSTPAQVTTAMPPLGWPDPTLAAELGLTFAGRNADA